MFFLFLIEKEKTFPFVKNLLLVLESSFFPPFTIPTKPTRELAGVWQCLILMPKLIYEVRVKRRLQLVAKVANHNRLY